MSSGLSDALHEMARHSSSRDDAPRDEGELFDDHPDASALHGEVDLEPAHDAAEAENVPARYDAPVENEVIAELDEEAASDRPRTVAAAGKVPPVRPRRAPVHRKQSGGLKAVAVPLMATVGILLMFPAVWGTMVLLGQSVWQSERPDAPTMAKAMLICWPLSLALIGLAFVLFVQVRSEQTLAKSTPSARPRR